MIEVVVEELKMLELKMIDLVSISFSFIFSYFLFFIERVQDKKDKVWYYYRSHEMVTEVTHSHNTEKSIDVIRWVCRQTLARVRVSEHRTVILLVYNEGRTCDLEVRWHRLE